jgi:hypothetical protein
VCSALREQGLHWKRDPQKLAGDNVLVHFKTGMYSDLNRTDGERLYSKEYGSRKFSCRREHRHIWGSIRSAGPLVF